MIVLTLILFGLKLPGEIFAVGQSPVAFIQYCVRGRLNHIICPIIMALILETTYTHKPKFSVFIVVIKDVRLIYGNHINRRFH